MDATFHGHLTSAIELHPLAESVFSKALNQWQKGHQTVTWASTPCEQNKHTNNLR
jgi:hypothetical protein